MPGLKWGRLQLDMDCKLRRGAWYRVVDLNGMHAVVNVNLRQLPVPSYALEVVTTPPKRWTVVPAPHHARVPREFAPHYLVCPNCRERAPIKGRVRRLACPRCRQMSDVDWSEEYLKLT